MKTPFIIHAQRSCKIGFILRPSKVRACLVAKEPMSLPKRKFTASDLVPGKTYQVISAFKDYDGIIHPVGEYWRFVKKNFLPYEDGLSLFVEKNGENISFRLQWRTETQGQIIDDFSDFVEEV